MANGNLAKRGSQKWLIGLERGEIKNVPAEWYKLRERAGIAITHVYHQWNGQTMIYMIVCEMH
jgi:hypothetical protein